MSKNVIEAVWEIAEPICKDLGLVLWDIRFLKEGPDWKLRLIIDREEGYVDINDCVELSRAMDKPLDELDPIEQSYSLQVQSPGIERELVRDWHIEKYIEKPVILKSHKAVGGRKEFKGILKSCDKEKIVIAIEGETKDFDRKTIYRIAADDFEGI
ncbi:MAG TPA: ribosome maturation factor RimP [Clostridiales bacterium]|nr:ribosome maturation factor RimP [Clostridiales bacterium]